MELWGLKEGSYLFQLTAARSDQPESTSNVTVTVLSPEQTEGKDVGRGGHCGRHPPPQLTGPSDAPDQLPSLPEYCLAPRKVGRCRGSFPRWYYEPTERICKSFVYGGCLGNKNNYLRDEECKLACHNVQGGPLRSSVGAQVTFPQGRCSLFTGSGRWAWEYPHP